MPVTRAQRTYPLALTADAINTGIVGAYDWAAESGGSGDNGADHSGLGHNWTPPASAPTIVATSVGNGRDTTRGGTVSGNIYTATADAIGLNVGTGDFSMWVRMQVPATPAPGDDVLRYLWRIKDAAAVELVANTYHLSSTNKWHIHFAGGMLSAFSSPGIDPGGIMDVHIVRASGSIKIYVNGVLQSTTANTLNFGTGGACIMGPWGPSGSELSQFVWIDSIHWNRALTPSEVVAQQANPYGLYANSAPADAVTITTPTTGTGGLGLNFTISGTYAGSGVPTAIEASFNGSAYQTIATGPTGGTFSGTFTGATPGTGSLTVRWANSTGVSNTVTGITVVAGSIAFSAPATVDAARDYRIFQRDNSNQATVRLKGTYTGSPTTIQWRWNGGTWATLVATPTGGTFDQTVTLTGPNQGALEVRHSNNTAISASLTAVGVGDVYIVAGQSNHVGAASAYVPAVAPVAHPAWKTTEYDKANNWRENVESASLKFDDRTGVVLTWAYPSGGPLGSYFGKLATLAMASGVPVAFVPCAMGSAGISNWQITGTSNLYYAQRLRAEDVGDHKAVLWWQGENDIGQTQAYYEGALNTLIDDWWTRYSRPWVLFAFSLAGSGGGAGAAGIRAAIANVAATNAHVSGYADMDGAYTGGVHYLTSGEIDEVAARAATALLYVADTAVPVMTGSVSASAITSTTYTVSGWGATDNVAVTGYEISYNGGTSFADIGLVTTYNVTGRTPSATDAVRIRAYDAAGNRSTPLSASVTLSAGSGDTTSPVMTGSISASAVASTSYTINGWGATDNVAVTGYELSLDGGSTYVDIGLVTTRNVTGRTPGATDAVRVRAYDAAGNRATPLSASVTLSAGSGARSATLVLTTDGTTPAASLSALKWAWFDETVPNLFQAPTAQGTGATTDASGTFSVSIAGTALNVGDVGWLIVTDSTGSPTQSPPHKAFSGPVVVA